MIRVTLIEDARIFREALIDRLSLEDEIEMVAGMHIGEIDDAVNHCPDVILFIARHLDHDELKCIADLHLRVPQGKILVVAPRLSPERLRQTLEVHIAGLLLHDVRLPHLIDALRTVASGGRVLDPDAAFSAINPSVSPLTRRELEMLGLLASGASLNEIASGVFLTPGTIRNYLASAVRKLNARNRLDAIRIAMDLGLLN